MEFDEAANPGKFLFGSVDIGHIPGHQIRPLKRIDVGDAFMHLPDHLFERRIVHVDPETWVAAGAAIVFGGGGVEVAVFLVLRQIR